MPISVGGHTCYHLSFGQKNNMRKLLSFIMKLILRNLSNFGTSHTFRQERHLKQTYCFGTLYYLSNHNKYSFWMGHHLIQFKDTMVFYIQ